jgi:hypothetical protein
LKVKSRNTQTLSLPKMWPRTIKYIRKWNAQKYVKLTERIY